MLKEFDPTDTLNKITLIRYFWEELCPSIRAQLNYQGRDLDAWEEVMEKPSDVEAKANLQPPFYVKDINTKCPKSHCPLAKKDKKDTYWEPRNKTSNKNKAKSNSSTSVNQP